MDAVEGEPTAAAAVGAGAAQHRCKVCGKGFSCGRSLGGHMRSHISLGEAVAEVVNGGGDELRRVSGANGGRSANGAAVGYGLRENPKKTRRLSDFADEEEEEEEEGGGGGGGDGGEHRACRECGKLFSSWRSLFGHMRSHASGPRDHDEEDDVDDLQGEEFFGEEAEAKAEEPEEESMVAPMEPPVPAPVAVIAAPPRRRRRSMRVAAPAPAPPPVLSGFEKEQEDVALCLLMLSRDTGLWNSPEKEEPLEKKEHHHQHRKPAAKQAYLTRNGYAYNSDDDSAPLQYGDARIKSGGGGIDVVKSKKRRTSYYAPNSSSPKQQCEVPAPPPAKRTCYECPGCGRVFSSYQALGGHRASHKRINTSCSAPKAAAIPAPAPEPSVETYTSFSTLSPSASPDSVAAGIGAKKPPAAAADKFQCPVCFRVFASGQALGGHKRSHIMAEAACSDDGELYGSASGGNAEQEQEHSVAAAGSLDLNFPPAPSEEA